MSLEINETLVCEVLLNDNKWYEIMLGSFYIDAYEFQADGYTDHFNMENNSPHNGFSFTDKNNVRVCGPLSSLHAFKLRVDKETKA